jgi:superfamily II DNA/RNA helicase
MEAEALTTQELTTQEPTAQELATQAPQVPFETVTLPTEQGTLVAAILPESQVGAETQIQPTEPHAAEAVAELKIFAEFGVDEPICAALEAAGITTAFPIQALTLPIALDGRDVIGQARTGTGKTLAFGIPILQHIADTSRGKRAAPLGLVVVPTRELAIQVADDLRTAAAGSDTNVVTLYGGRAYEPQIEALATVDVVVGTPGRLLDLSRQNQLDLSGVDILVLDEADRMLDLGFLPDVEAILRLTPQHRQTMLFSATMPAEVVTLARRHLYQPIHIRAEQHDEPAHVPTTDQHVFRAHHLDKIEVLARVLQAEGRGLTIVFCRTRRACDTVTAALAERGFAAAAVHGDLGQSQRERALRAFRAGKVDVLVATDVAARGLDVDDVTHVINNECPEDDKAYLHRIGRTGRAGRTGIAVTFVDWQDMARWKLINETLNLGHPDPLETYSTSDHLFTALHIPVGVRGSLPRAQRGRAGLEAEDLEDIGETGRSRSRQQPAGSDRGPRARDDRSGDGGSGRSGRRPSGRTETGRGTTGRRDPGQHESGPSQVDRVEAGQPDAATRAKPNRRRTRGGAPVGSSVGPAAGQPAGAAQGPSERAADADPASGDRPRKRRRSGRGRGSRVVSGHSAESQHGPTHPAESQRDSTRPASQAERRDLAAD